MGSISSSSSPAAPAPFVPTLEVEVEVLPFLRGLAVLQMQMRTNAENSQPLPFLARRRRKAERGEKEVKVGSGRSR